MACGEPKQDELEATIDNLATVDTAARLSHSKTYKMSRWHHVTIKGRWLMAMMGVVVVRLHMHKQSCDHPSQHHTCSPRVGEHTQATCSTAPQHSNLKLHLNISSQSSCLKSSVLTAQSSQLRAHITAERCWGYQSAQHMQPQTSLHHPTTRTFAERCCPANWQATRRQHEANTPPAKAHWQHRALCYDLPHPKPKPSTGTRLHSTGLPTPRRWP